MNQTNEKKSSSSKYLNGYSQLRINVKKEKLELYKQYVAHKGTSLYSLVTSMLDEMIEADGFTPEPTETTEE